MIPESEWMPIVDRVIKHFEASDVCHVKSYIVEGEEHLQATNGWGRAVPLHLHPQLITPLIADRWLQEDIKVRFDKFVARVPQKVRDKMNKYQIAAFISWAYNGVDSLWHCDSFKALCAGDFHGWATGECEWDNHDMPGLVRRRAVERHLIERGEFERLFDRGRNGLNIYLDLIGAVNAGKRQKKTGHLVWIGDRLQWKLAG
jgi:GH24 family phage-related lysozyme (muramidase)